MDIPEIVLAILRAIWLMVPMLIPNSAAVLFGGGRPIDFGKKMKDGTRILGDGKTWNGLIGGTLSGVIIGMIQILIMSTLGQPDWTVGCFTCGALPILFLLAFGSMFGDMLGSFLKRRAKIARGAKFPIMDQYDFFIGAMILIVPLQWTWFYDNFIDGVYLAGFIGLIVLIPIMHRLVNIIGFKMGKKDVPW
jgi:CDP-2,3-bis-(O-geranylgeranyl)-sn-glycerol synthase